MTSSLTERQAPLPRPHGHSRITYAALKSMGRRLARTHQCQGRQCPTITVSMFSLSNWPMGGRSARRRESIPLGRARADFLRRLFPALRSRVAGCGQVCPPVPLPISERVRFPHGTPSASVCCRKCIASAMATVTSRHVVNMNTVLSSLRSGSPQPGNHVRCPDCQSDKLTVLGPVGVETIDGVLHGRRSRCLNGSRDVCAPRRLHAHGESRLGSVRFAITEIREHDSRA